METCVRRISQKTGGYGKGIADTQEVGESQSDELVLVSWYEEVEASVIHVPVGDPSADDDADDAETEAEGMLSRRSKREAVKAESGSGDTKGKRKVAGTTGAPKSAKKKDRKGISRSNTSLIIYSYVT